MSNNMVPFNAGARPSYLPAAKDNASLTDLTAGVSSSFPVLRMKGKVWAISSNGQTKNLLTPEGYPVPAMRVVLVKANPYVSKTFYKDGFEEGVSAPPDCWSFDGVKPDTSVQHPCAASCAACPNNRLGSKISESGSRVKACPDVKRIAVMDPRSGTLMLLRLPYTSMKSLADYAVALSNQPTPVNYNEVITEMAFDVGSAFPKIVFKPVRWLSEAEMALTQAALGDTVLQEILGGSPGEFHHEPAAPRPAPEPPAASTFDNEEDETPPPPPKAAPKAAPKAKAAPAPEPVQPSAPAPKAAPIVVEGGSLDDALSKALGL